MPIYSMAFSNLGRWDAGQYLYQINYVSCLSITYHSQFHKITNIFEYSKINVMIGSIGTIIVL